jgi:quinol monooxygenase YgiN
MVDAGSPYTEIGADMSGRRRHGDDWDDGRLDAQRDRRDPWADDNVDEWGGRDREWSDRDPEWSDRDPGHEADRSGGHAGYGAGAYVSQGAAGKGYAAPSFPSFSSVNHNAKPFPPAGRPQNGHAAGHGSDRRGGDSDSGYGQRGAPAVRDAGYGGDGHRDAGYGGGDDWGGRYGDPGYGAGGHGDDPGYASGSGFGSANGRPAGYAPEFIPVDSDGPEDEGSAAARPVGRLSIYTLHDDRAREFDWLAERVAESVRTAEPDTLVYVVHLVPKAPNQRIIYEMYRDRAAYLSHEQQSHIRQFAKDRASCVLATNVIDLRLRYAKIAPLGPAADAAPQPQQPTWTPKDDRYAAPATQYSPAQGSGTAAAATFTPADRYQGGGGQYRSSDREQHGPATRYENSGNGAYGAGNSQYGAGNGYSSADGYANGGSYSSANGYAGANSYQGSNGYSGANGYQNANGYSGANGYADGNDYPNGSSYSGASGYQNDGGNDYRADGYAWNGRGSYSDEYPTRYRELTSGGSSSAGAPPDDDGRYPSDGRQGSR